MEYQDTEQKRKIRIVTIATIVAVVVLGLGVWLVVAAISSTKKNNNTVATESSVTERKDTTKPDADKQGNPTATSPANQYGATEQKTTTTSAAATTPATPAKQEVPSTGPEDMVPVAILAGVATYLIGLNINLKKHAAKREA